MKKILGLLLAAAVLTSCEKGFERESSNNFATVAFLNAAPGTGTTTLNTSGSVFIDSIAQTGAVAYRAGTGYLSVAPGSHVIQFRSTSTLDSARLFQTTASFDAGRAYTYILYDTMTTTNRTVRSLRLEDDLTLPAAGTAKFRFLNLISNTPAGGYDVTFLRTNVATPDSVTLSAQSYIGNNPDPKAVSVFNRTLPLGPSGAYTIKVKVAGTQTVITSATFNFSTAAGNQGIATVYITGNAAGNGVGIGAFRHYP